MLYAYENILSGFGLLRCHLDKKKYGDAKHCEINIVLGTFITKFASAFIWSVPWTFALLRESRFTEY